ncbi:MAG: prepilin peptidase [Chloroflexota bacterium]
MSHHLSIVPLWGVLGITAGAIILYASPRLVSYRLSDRIAFPSAWVLIPIWGIRAEGWRPRSSLGIELSTGIVFAALAAHYGPNIQLLLSSAYSAVFISVAYIDIDHRLVLNRLSYPAALLAIPSAMLWPGFGVRSALLGAAVGGVVFLVLQAAGRGALGTGDTKLAIVIGAIRGFPAVFDALLLGMLFGGVAALILLVVFRRGRKQYIAYAPYLSAGAILSFFLTT